MSQDLIVKASKNNFLEKVLAVNNFHNRSNRDGTRVGGRIPVDAAADRGKSHARARVAARKREAIAVAGREQRGFICASTLPDWPDGVNHVAGR